MAENIRVGLIGLDGIGMAHEAGYTDTNGLAQITAVCDTNADTVQDRATMYDARGYTRYQDLLDDPNVDLVDICVPHTLHYEMAMASIEAGKHTIVEKPITVRSPEGLRLVQRAKEKGVHFTVAENTRFVTAYRKVEEILKEGTLGEIWTVRTLIAGSEVYRLKDPNLWHGKAPYGGVILDSAVHSLYLLKWLFGGLKDVFGFASKIVPEGEMEDNGLIVGHLVNGADFQLNVSCTMEIPWTERLEIYGSKAGLIVDQLVDPVVKLYQGSGDFDGTVYDVPYEPAGWKYFSIMEECKDFVAVVAENRPPQVDPMDCVYAVQVVEAVEASLQAGKPVTL